MSSSYSMVIYAFFFVSLAVTASAIYSKCPIFCFLCARFSLCCVAGSFFNCHYKLFLFGFGCRARIFIYDRYNIQTISSSSSMHGGFVCGAVCVRIVKCSALKLLLYFLVPISFLLNYFSVFFSFFSVCSSAWAWAGAPYGN